MVKLWPVCLSRGSDGRIHRPRIYGVCAPSPFTNGRIGEIESDSETLNQRAVCSTLFLDFWRDRIFTFHGRRRMEKPNKSEWRKDPVVCINCGRRDSYHVSKLCAACRNPSGKTSRFSTFTATGEPPKRKWKKSEDVW